MRIPAAFACSFVLVTSACGESDPPTMPMSDASMIACTSDATCSDGLFCNGVEHCVHGECVTTQSCHRGQTCDEQHTSCFTTCSVTMDADGDGAIAEECGGNDCDDNNPSRYPGNLEVCDVNDTDEDCDPSTFGVRDQDMDGVADERCCNVQTDGSRLCGTDCDDTSSNVSPRAPEVCNGIDDDCDGHVDEGVLTMFWVDHDGDGFGAMGTTPITGCNRPVGYAPTGDDCNDDNRAINPGAVEVCDGATDEDCDGIVDDTPMGCTCSDGQSRDCGLMGRCAGATQSCSGGTYGVCSVVPIPETCNHVDDDCDGRVDEGQTVQCYLDMDGDGVPTFGAVETQQCPDETRSASPQLRCPLFYTGVASTSVAMGDCDDSRAMQTVPDACYHDSDHDTYGAGAPTYKCPADPCPSGSVGNARDCCDTDANMRPGQTAYFPNGSCTSTLGGYDYNCDGRADREYGTYTCSPFGTGCLAGAVGGDSVHPYMSGTVSCGSLGNFADGCARSGSTCHTTWSGASGTGSYGEQACR